MKKLLAVFSLIFLTAYCFSQNNYPDCAKFKTGKFQYIDSSKVIIVNRKKNIQEEVAINTGAKTRLKIHWVDNCVYDLKQVWTNRKDKRKMNGSVTRVNIIKTYDNRYDYTCACKDSASINKNRGTMFLIK